MTTESCSYICDEDGFEIYGEPNLTGTPERNLLMAVLERAIRDYVGNSRHEVKEAEEWIFKQRMDLPYIEFSFAWVCHQLDLEPQRIADLIAAMPKRGERRTAPWYFMKEAS